MFRYHVELLSRLHVAFLLGSTLLTFPGVSAPGTAQSTDRSSNVRGQVLAHESGDPLSGVIVRLGSWQVLSDDNGRFRIDDIPPGRYSLELEYLGRSPLAETVVFNGTPLIGMEIRMRVDPIELEPLEVIGERRSMHLDAIGFYDRRDKSGVDAVHITREEIDRNPSNRLSDVLDRIPGTRLVPVANVPGAVLLRMNRHWAAQARAGNQLNTPGGAPSGCEPDVYLNGQLQRDRLSAPPGHPLLLDINLIELGAVDGIEVYTGATAPAGFRSNGCGLVLIWTRVG